MTFVSVFKVDQFLEVLRFANKNGVEEAIRAGGMPYTILRPAYFAQNERPFKSELTGLDVYPIPAGNQGLAVVDVRDLAEAAAISLTEEGHNGKTYDLVSSEMLKVRMRQLHGRDCLANKSLMLDTQISTALKRRCGKEGVQVGGPGSSDHVPGFRRAEIQQHRKPGGALCCLAWAPAENVQQLR